MNACVVRRPIIDMKVYEASLKARMGPTAPFLQGIHARARQAQARMILAEADDPRVPPSPISAPDWARRWLLGAKMTSGTSWKRQV